MPTNVTCSDISQFRIASIARHRRERRLLRRVPGPGTRIHTLTSAFSISMPRPADVSRPSPHTFRLSARHSCSRLGRYGQAKESLAPLSSRDPFRVLLVGDHGSVDDVGEAAFEDAEGFHTAVAVVLAPLEQFTSGW